MSDGTHTRTEGLRTSEVEIEYIHRELEVPNWAPWLAFGLEDLKGQERVFPDGQFVITDDSDKPIGALSTNRVDWSGDIDDLLHWDDVAGEDLSYADTYSHYGNSLAFMSMSIDPEAKGQRASSRLVNLAVEYARRESIEYIIGDFRPSDYGKYKRETGRFDFEEYCQLTKEDGSLKDGWLRAVTRLGMTPLKVDNRAMVAPASIEDFESYRSGYNPEKWWQVTDSEKVAKLSEWYEVNQDVSEVSEVWECGEAGTWFVDTKAGKAVYIESNLWGEIDIADTDDDITTTGMEGSRANKLSVALLVARRAIETGVMVFEFGPWNEGLRFGAAALAQAAGAEPIVVAGVLGGTTLITEGACAIAAADLLDSKSGKKWVTKMNDFAEKRGVPKDLQTGPVTKSAVAYLGGTAVLELVKHREDPERTRRQNAAYGLKAALGLSGVLALQGYAISKGISYPNPETIALATLSVASVFALMKLAAKRLRGSGDKSQLELAETGKP